MLSRERLVELLCAGENLTAESERVILEAGDGVVESLISIMMDEALGDDKSPGEGFAPIHATKLLAKLRAEPAIAPMLQLLAETHDEAMIHDAIVVHLPEIGAAVVEPALAAYHATRDYQLKSSLAEILVSSRVRDERIFQLLVDHFEIDAHQAVIELGEYGDPRALPILLEEFDAYELDKELDREYPNQELIDIREAIDALGGTLSVEQEAKFEIALEPHLEVSALEKSVPAVRRERPGRNDPCWCGSTTKYKKCHLEADEAEARKA
jgi:HEAT repeat protein